MPYGKSEFEAAGGILKEPIEIFNMPKTGLPVPANAEIAFEGFIHPDDMIQEGPLGEWTGYYAGEADQNLPFGSKPSCIEITRFSLGRYQQCPNDNTYYLGIYSMWGRLEPIRSCRHT